jgi:hypothetical protein
VTRPFERFLFKTNTTFKKESRGLLLHNLVNINNYSKTFPALQLFATKKRARVFKKVKEIWDQVIFHNCASPALFARDFTTGLAASVARSAVKKKEAARRAKESSSAKGKGKAVNIGGVDKNRDEVAAASGINNVVAAHPKLPPYEPERTSRTQLSYRMACI